MTSALRKRRLTLRSICEDEGMSSSSDSECELPQEPLDDKWFQSQPWYQRWLTVFLLIIAIIACLGVIFSVWYKALTTPSETTVTPEFKFNTSCLPTTNPILLWFNIDGLSQLEFDEYMDTVWKEYRDYENFLSIRSLVDMSTASIGIRPTFPPTFINTFMGMNEGIQSRNGNGLTPEYQREFTKIHSKKSAVWYKCVECESEKFELEAEIFQWLDLKAQGDTLESYENSLRIFGTDLAYATAMNKTDRMANRQVPSSVYYNVIDYLREPTLETLTEIFFELHKLLIGHLKINNNCVNVVITSTPGRLTSKLITDFPRKYKNANRTHAEYNKTVIERTTSTAEYSMFQRKDFPLDWESAVDDDITYVALAKPGFQFEVNPRNPTFENISSMYYGRNNRSSMGVFLAFGSTLPERNVRIPALEVVHVNQLLEENFLSSKVQNVFSRDGSFVDFLWEETSPDSEALKTLIECDKIGVKFKRVSNGDCGPINTIPLEDPFMGPEIENGFWIPHWTDDSCRERIANRRQLMSVRPNGELIHVEANLKSNFYRTSQQSATNCTVAFLNRTIDYANPGMSLFSPSDVRFSWMDAYVPEVTNFTKTVWKYLQSEMQSNLHKSPEGMRMIAGSVRNNENIVSHIYAIFVHCKNYCHEILETDFPSFAVFLPNVEDLQLPPLEVIDIYTVSIADIEKEVGGVFTRPNSPANFKTTRTVFLSEFLNHTPPTVPADGK